MNLDKIIQLVTRINWNCYLQVSRYTVYNHFLIRFSCFTWKSELQRERGRVQREIFHMWVHSKMIMWPKLGVGSFFLFSHMEAETKALDSPLLPSLTVSSIYLKCSIQHSNQCPHRMPVLAGRWLVSYATMLEPILILNCILL